MFMGFNVTMACVLPKTIGELVRVKCRYSRSFILFEQSFVSKSAKFAERRTISSLYRGHTGLARNSSLSSVTLTFLWLISLSYLLCAIYTFDQTTFVYDNSIVLIKERLYDISSGFKKWYWNLSNFRFSSPGKWSNNWILLICAILYYTVNIGTQSICSNTLVITQILIVSELHLHFVFSNSDPVYFSSIRFVSSQLWYRNTIRPSF